MPLSAASGSTKGRSGSRTSWVEDLNLKLELHHGGRTYRILQTIGEGGFGKVYKALCEETGEFVAVKQLKDARCGDRFRREANVMSRFRDSCFTRFIDYFDDDLGTGTESFLVMEYLSDMPGSSLKDVISRRKSRGEQPLPGSDVLRAFARYAHALSVLHREGVFHRDIKPANLYYPEGAPERAAVMDFGIVRDVFGTLTNGGLIGSFDYMPPESVKANFHGSAGMDVYALGLCLYEALTGESGFARLRGGTSAVIDFYQRAKSQAVPAFNHSEIIRRPRVRELLCRMTDPVASRRLSDASAVENILLNMDWDEPQPASSRSGAPVIHAFALCAKVLLSGIVLVAAGLALLFVWPFIHEFFTGKDSPPPPHAMPASTTSPQVPLSDPAEPSRTDEDVAALEADAVEATFLSDGHATGAKALAGWLSRWRAKRLSSAFIASRTNAFAQAVAFRTAIEKQRKEGTAAAVARRKAIAEKTRDAAAAAERIVDAYSDPDIPLQVTVGQHARWTSDWQALEDELSFDRLESDLADARAEREREERGATLADKCRKILAAALSDDFSHWRDGLSLSQQMLTDAVNASAIGPLSARALRRELDAADKWTVGAIANRSLVYIEFAGEKIPPLSTKTFAFTNGIPDPSCVILPGMKPIPVDLAAFDSRTIEITDADFVRREGSGLIRVPPLSSGVICLVDGIQLACGETPFAPGRHVCIYRNGKMTHAGIRDFRDNRCIVEVAAGVCATLPPPAEWIETLEFQTAREKVQQEKRGERLFARCLHLLRLQPVESRQARLSEALSAFSSYEGGLLLDSESLRILHARHGLERRRIAGFVENHTARDLTVVVWAQRLPLPAHCRTLVVYDNGSRVSAQVTAPGVAPVPIPASALDGASFDVFPDMLKPLPAKLSLPVLDEDVSCFISGRRVDRSISLLPGRYVCAYRKHGCEDQRFRFDVTESGGALPPPGEWKGKNTGE